MLRPPQGRLGRGQAEAPQSSTLHCLRGLQMFQVAAPSGQEMCPVGPPSSCASGIWLPKVTGLALSFPLGRDRGAPNPSHPTLSPWLMAGDSGSGEGAGGAFLWVDKTRCVVVWCGVTHCVRLCMFLCREQDLQRSHPCLWTHMHMCPLCVNLCGGSQCSFLVLLQQMADLSVGYLYPRLIFCSVLLLSVNMFQVLKA